MSKINIVTLDTLDDSENDNVFNITDISDIEIFLDELKDVDNEHEFIYAVVYDICTNPELENDEDINSISELENWIYLNKY